MDVRLAIRVPAWSRDIKICVNGAPAQHEIEVRNGYAYLHGTFCKPTEVAVELDMSVRKLYANSKVAANTGKAAVERGPLVYCAEGVDNGDDVLSLSYKRGGRVTVGKYLPDKLCGIRELYAEGYREKGSEDLYSCEPPVREACRITLVPYYTWGNRGLNQMWVWIPEI